MSVYDVGDQPTVTATFRDDDGNLADPDEVMLTVTGPDGTETTYTYSEPGTPITKASTGVYECPIELTDWGDWRYRWWSTGNGQTAEAGTLYARRA